MKRVLSSLLICIATFSAVAQYPGAGGGGPRPGGGRGGQSLNIGHFYGKVVDKKSSRAVPGASVQLMVSRFDTATKTSKQRVASGMLTKSNGDFSLENLPVMGRFHLVITAIGYKSVDQNVSFDLKMPQGQGQGMEQAMAAIDKDLGNIKLDADAEVLQNVVVTSSKPLLQMGVDRKVFNVDKNIVSTGQTAQEIMKSIPSVNVDIDGNVTLRNAAPTIFVDGRPTTLTLDQIPADAIESVEIITNPSAKFDASGGTAGILNIVLKKNRKTGYNGNVRAGVDSRGKLNGGADINIKQGKINLFASANYNQRLSKSTSTTFRHQLVAPLGDVNQYSHGQNDGSFAFGRAGFDYLMDNRNTFTVSGVIVDGKFNNSDNLQFDSLRNSSIFSKGSQLTNTRFHFRNYGSSLSFKHLFAKAGKDITADLNYNSSENNSNGLYTTQRYTPADIKTGLPQLRQTYGDGSEKRFTGQLDYTDPITENSKIEAGARIAVRDNTSINDSYLYDTASQGYLKSSTLSNNYKFTDRVYAGYATFSNKIGTFSYQAGLRAESSDYTGTLLQASKSTFKTNYPISLFPSLFITKTFKNSQDFQINYSRRINRPNFFQLIPYTDVSDPQNITVGNPALKPEFTNSFEMSYQKTFERNNSLLVTAYFKNSTDLITRYTYRGVVKDLNVDSAYFTTYRNANSSMSYGLEVTSHNPLAKWWDMTTNVNLYNSKIDAGNIDNSLQSQRVSYFVKWNNSFKLPANFSIQLSGDYQSKAVLPQSSGGGGGGRGGGGGGGPWGGGPQPTAQGYVNANYGFDVAIRKDMFKNKAASLTLSMNDIFRTRRYSYHSESTSFTQDYERRRDAQLMRLNFSYRFGKLDVSLFKRKNTKNQGDMPDIPM